MREIPGIFSGLEPGCPRSGIDHEDHFQTAFNASCLDNFFISFTHNLTSSLYSCVYNAGKLPVGFEEVETGRGFVV